MSDYAMLPPRADADAELTLPLMSERRALMTLADARAPRRCTFILSHLFTPSHLFVYAMSICLRDMLTSRRAITV